MSQRLLFWQSTVLSLPSPNLDHHNQVTRDLSCSSWHISFSTFSNGPLSLLSLSEFPLIKSSPSVRNIINAIGITHSFRCTFVSFSCALMLNWAYESPGPHCLSSQEVDPLGRCCSRLLTGEYMDVVVVRFPICFWYRVLKPSIIGGHIGNVERNQASFELGWGKDTGL